MDNIYQAITHHITQLLIAKDFTETTVDTKFAGHCVYGRLKSYSHFNPATGAIVRVNIAFHNSTLKVYSNTSKQIPWGTSNTQSSFLKSLSVDITSPDFLDKIVQFFDVLLS